MDTPFIDFMRNLNLWTTWKSSGRHNGIQKNSFPFWCRCRVPDAWNAFKKHAEWIGPSFCLCVSYFAFSKYSGTVDTQYIISKLCDCAEHILEITWADWPFELQRVPTWGPTSAKRRPNDRLSSKGGPPNTCSWLLFLLVGACWSPLDLLLVLFLSQFAALTLYF